MKFKLKYTFETFDEAFDIHQKLFRIIRENHYVTYADLCYLMARNKVKELDSTCCEYGWTNLIDCKIESVKKYKNEQWVLKMPPIELLEKENK